MAKVPEKAEDGGPDGLPATDGQAAPLAGTAAGIAIPPSSNITTELDSQAGPAVIEEGGTSYELSTDRAAGAVTDRTGEKPPVSGATQAVIYQAEGAEPASGKKLGAYQAKIGTFKSDVDIVDTEALPLMSFPTTTLL